MRGRYIIIFFKPALCIWLSLIKQVSHI